MKGIEENCASGRWLEHGEGKPVGFVNDIKNFMT
jgi:hypothetical protein